SPFVTSGVRIGTPAVTTRGMKEPEMKRIAALITHVIREGEGCLPEVKQEVLDICARYPLYADCVRD
ncbi:MAG: serine hydroxymethyltransferase, partial [Peptococcaceae bacterium]|nr:serine hydroxymethyltransferase [Peptococcaceae bacterium]